MDIYDMVNLLYPVHSFVMSPEISSLSSIFYQDLLAVMVILSTFPGYGIDSVGISYISHRGVNRG